MPRLPTTSSACVAYRDITEIEIDRFISHRNIWKNVKKVHLKTRWFTMVPRNSELIIIGGKNSQEQALNSVNIEAIFTILKILPF